MKHNLSADEISGSFRSALRSGIKPGSLMMFHDLSHLLGRLRHLQEVFPAHAIHAVAMKANPLVKLLRLLKDHGAAAEVASFGELKLAEHAGYAKQDIVFDSPVKTFEELEYAIRAGVHVNIDSLPELDRIREIRKNIPGSGTFGIRINPQVGTGKIITSSVAGEYSKFGVPVKYRRQELTDAFLENEWLTGVHLHVGSQGCHPGLLVEGAAIVYELADEINRRKGFRQIRIFDLGGGFPVSYHPDQEAFAIEDYAAALRNKLPELFGDGITLITEFGRWLHVNAGWTVSRVEYVKNDGGVRTAMLHAGADLFLRECLLPADWRHEYLVLDQEGFLKDNGPLTPCHLAGPLCFSGDMLARDVLLPPVEEGDYLVIRDTGGYTLSMWSMYNSRFMPPVTGYREDQFITLRKGETAEDLIRFWE